MPKVWTDTIETHRRVVRDAILNTTVVLASEHGLLGITMTQIAEDAGIGRATLYKYFPDVESIVVALHERQVAGQLAQLEKIRDRAGNPHAALKAVLEAFALIHYERDSAQLSNFLHFDGDEDPGERHLRDFIKELLAEGAHIGDLRDDVAPDELAGYCVHALGAATQLPSKAAVRRLVNTILTGLQPAH